MILSTKTEEILQRSQLKSIPRPMAPIPATNNTASEIPLSANLKEIKESIQQPKDETENQKEWKDYSDESAVNFWPKFL